ncbi:M15 family metallopeptidase [Treponema sp. J25]|uniref:M15 family metallopeptidase n=1 Tax=Treponema sp. J25 TaxID=2094121 RepID=UPI001045672F|nr:M15 family metallopeptidase [Treponema sp. J25]TCW61957.1 D-alanyl-D-alanine carboxypeptidase [Treponema sp. J25]
MRFVKSYIAGILFWILVVTFSCSGKEEKANAEEIGKIITPSLAEQIQATAESLRLPRNIYEPLLAKARKTPDAVIRELTVIYNLDPYLWKLVDKQHGLDPSYEPADLVPLRSNVYRLSREGLTLRQEAAKALEAMAEAARKEGVTLVVSSTYRSYNYQKSVYERNVRQMGQAATDRESARPGHSQHQLGTVVDFGSIDDSFAKTAASRWLERNASRYGWSLSFPQGYEAVTGYRWESWHYRYLSPVLCDFIDTYFQGIQQYGLLFLHYFQEPFKKSFMPSSYPLP